MVDIPDNATTPASVAVGGSYSDLIEVSGDLDWIAVTLTAGTTATITLDASGPTPIEDPYLVLFDGAGNFIAENDDGDATSLNSLLTFAVETSGTYYIEAGTFGPLDTGGYTVGVTAVPDPPQDLLATLAWGTEVASPAVSVYFAMAGEIFDGTTSEGFNAYERSRFQAAFDLIEAVCGLTFNIVTNAAAAAFRLVLDTNENTSDLLGYFNPPGEANAGVGVFYAGESWDRAAGGNLDAGGYGMVTIVHELLHGLGMAHPHDTGGTSTIMNGVSASFGDYGLYNLNQGLFTTMSYNSGYFTGTPGSQGDPGNRFGYEYGPMALDIALLQRLYGANTATNAGNTVYVLDTVNAVGTWWQAIWDAGGSADEIRHTGTAGSVIDLRAATLLGEPGGGGFVSAVDGIAGGHTIASGVVIENASGGSGRDVITGNAAANLLAGNNGNDALDGGAGGDTLRGGAGADRLDGGLGNDTLEGGLGNDSYFVNAAGDVVTGEVAFGSGGGIDTVTTSVNFTAPANVELVRAQAGAGGLTLIGNDAPGTLVGNEAANRLEGRGGNDQVNGNAGADTIVGGEGADTLVGGAGADSFVFLSVSNSRAGALNRDVINGFERGAVQDRIDLSAIDANTLTAGVNDAFTFIGTAAFSGGGAAGAGQLRLVGTGSTAVIVAGDVNGDGVADIQIFVNTQTTMGLGDFIL